MADSSQQGYRFAGANAGGRAPRVAVLGGGPAGSFCAIWLSALAAGRGRRFEITLFDHKSFEKPGPAGCNMCAGIIPHSLVRNMRRLGMELPQHVIQRRIAGYRLETKGGFVDIPTRPGVELYSTFRGPGPLGMYPSAQEGFDYFLLHEAEKRGVRYVNALVTDVTLPPSPAEPCLITCRDCGPYEADIVVGAFGVNSNLTRVFEGLGFGYRTPEVARAFQAEIPVDPDFIARGMRDRVFIFTGVPHLKFAAMTPKREHVTVTLIGADPKRFDLESFLASNEVRERMPAGWEAPCRFCSCAPRLPLTAAHHAVHDRIVIIGDAHVARYLKNGIESSFHTAYWAARAIAGGHLSADALSREYVSRCQYYVRDNRYGRALFRLHDAISASPTIARAHIEVARREQASPQRPKRLSTILWGMFTGNIPYRGIALRLLDPRVHWDIAVALVRERGQPTSLRAAAPRSYEGQGKTEDSGSVATAMEPEGERFRRAERAKSQPRAAVPHAETLGPLGPEQTAIIIGGGPAGAACAITLAHEGERLRRVPRIVLVEEKRFGEHQNQCSGVISPPGLIMIADMLGVRVPDDLIQREIRGYVLHANGDALELDGDELGERGTALRRVQLDHLLLEAARHAGAQIVHARADDLEVNGDGVVVYTDSGTFHGDVVVGAFGLDPGIAQAFARATPYRHPASLETLACKLHPAGLEPIPGLLGDQIHVFLPPERRIEFGAMIPKGNHVTVIVAGRRLHEADMTSFLTKCAARLLPPACDIQGAFKGSFPLGPARHLYGDRYVVLGDAAGLVRPFKGKGINAAIEAGWLAARTMLTRGISRGAFDEFARSRRHLTGDLNYGRLVRWLTGSVSRWRLLPPFVTQARRDADLRQELFDCVSGRTTYRDVVLRRCNRRLIPLMVWQCARYLMSGRNRRSDKDQQAKQALPLKP
jgi:flavin-dependent dehydrogenase